MVELSTEKLISAIQLRIQQTRTGSANEPASASINIDDLVHRSSINLILHMFYNQKSRIDFNSEVDPLVENINSSLRAYKSKVFKLSMMYPLLSYVLGLILRLTKIGKYRRDVLNMIKEHQRMNLLAKQLEVGTAPDDTNIKIENSDSTRLNPVGSLFKDVNEGILTENECLNTSMFLFEASHKSLSDIIVTLIYQLVKCPDVQVKLRDEIHSKGCQSDYLTWCINETMRLYPPVLMACTRTVAQDVDMGAFKIPRGALVLAPIYTIHRSEEYWGEDANKFRPERWLNCQNFHPMQFLPFGAGERYCAGMHLAQRLVRLMLVPLLKKFKYEQTDKTPERLHFSTPLFLFLCFDELIYVKVTEI